MLADTDHSACSHCCVLRSGIIKGASASHFLNVKNDFISCTWGFNWLSIKRLPLLSITGLYQCCQQGVNYQGRGHNLLSQGHRPQGQRQAKCKAGGRT